ncbi:hypothetical protein GGR28_003583 [Lewinella aquimaris]|uniref:Uncharacterized protein n=1 Tax=Neolewinella aquimaris TaxID=1835722 RepID=A0A840E5M0_9BACT|nr:hypothetical protein [Neolewinella aquimaris]MBB4080944.1 hypothetical protein [Neolewinella aquimaris]
MDDSSPPAATEIDKRETFTLTKPVNPGLPIDHSALEELHLGPIPCIRVRAAPNQDLDPTQKPGTERVFNGRMTVINLPKGFSRIDSLAWNEDMQSHYGKKQADGKLVHTPLVTGAQHSHFFFWLYDLQHGPADEADKFSTAAPDFCHHAREDDPPGIVFWDGRDNACDRMFIVDSADTVESGPVGVPFVCAYDYYPNTVYKTELRDLLRDKYFRRIPSSGNGEPTKEEVERRSEAPLKMLATVIPGRGIVWLPLVEGKENKAAYDKLTGGGTVVIYRLQFLDGPNILIGKLDDTPW